jgi:tetratricopeptide (TPR) repeat protein
MAVAEQDTQDALMDVSSFPKNAAPSIDTLDNNGLEAILIGMAKIIEATQTLTARPQSDIADDALATSLAVQKGAVDILKGGLSLQQRTQAESHATCAAPFLMDAAEGYLKEGNHARAEHCLKQAVSVHPQGRDILKKMGDLYLGTNKYDAAISSYEAALQTFDDESAIENNLAVAYLANSDYAAAQRTITKGLLREHGLPPQLAAKCDLTANLKITSKATEYSSAFKLKNQAEQIQYLMEEGLISSSFHSLSDQLNRLSSTLSSVSGNSIVSLTESQSSLLGPYSNALLQYDDRPAPSGDPFLNPDLNYDDLQQEYLDTRMIYFDDLLTDCALQRLREALLRSTIFYRISPAGFVGTYFTDGFAFNILFAIIQALSDRLPRLLTNKPINNLWAYRYDTKGEGVRPHNGDGSITLNLWLTPDNANLTPGSGGLVMYDKEHPTDWDWLHTNMYKDNSDVQQRIAEYLADAKATVIPYKCNRAVLFHSTLFHKTDPYEFKDGYLNRRMNMTVLFGKRGQEAIALR